MEANFVTRDEVKAERNDIIKDSRNSETSLKQEIQMVKQELRQEIQMVKQELKQEIQIVRQEIKMSEQRAVIRLSGVMIILFGIATTLIGWMIKGVNLPH